MRAQTVGGAAGWAIGLSVSVAGCSLFGSPTTFTQTTPVQIAANGSSLIFKNSSESDNCGLGEGTISFVADARDRRAGASLRFSYSHPGTSPRSDVITFTTQAGELSIDGRGAFGFSTASGAASPKALRSLNPGGERLRKAGTTLSLKPQRSGRYVVEIEQAGGADVFKGTVMPVDGVVYIRDAVFSSIVSSYEVNSQHNCANWNSPEEATKALQRVEASIPS